MAAETHHMLRPRAGRSTTAPRWARRRRRRDGAPRTPLLASILIAGIGTCAPSATATAATSPARTVHGVVLGVHGTALELRVTARHAHSSTMTVLLTTRTRYRLDGHRAQRPALHDGERLLVRLQTVSTGTTAVAVRILTPQWTGTLRALRHGGFLISTRQRTVRHVVLTHATRVRTAGRVTTTTALRDGERVRVTGALAHGVMTARTVVVLGTHHRSRAVTGSRSTSPPRRRST